LLILFFDDHIDSITITTKDIQAFIFDKKSIQKGDLIFSSIDVNIEEF